MRTTRYGFGGRFFPGNWRPPGTEIEFAAAAGFSYVQFRSDEPGDLPSVLRTPLRDVARALEACQVDATVELLVRLNAAGATTGGLRLEAALERSLPAIEALGCEVVHVHAVASPPLGELPRLTSTVVASLARCVEIASTHGFAFGFEHNAAPAQPFANLDDCTSALSAVPGLGFTWDTNHTSPADMGLARSLFARTIAVHVSDTELPRTNDHLPIGLGNSDFRPLIDGLRSGELDCPVILEIGGLPQSGGYGRDTDEALVESLRRLQQMGP